LKFRAKSSCNTWKTKQIREYNHFELGFVRILKHPYAVIKACTNAYAHKHINLNFTCSYWI